MSDIQHSKALVSAGLASVERGEGMDGEAALDGLIAETRALYGG